MAKKKKKVDEQLILEGVTPPNVSRAEKAEESKVEEIDPNQITLDDFIDDSILEKETVQELMKEAVASEQKQTKKKSFITNIFFLVINVVYLAFIVKNLLNSANDSNLSSVIQEQGAKLWWLMGGLGLLILFFVCETLLYFALIKSTTGKNRLFLSYRIASVGKYYDFITPTQMGGQPSQILRLTKSGMSAGLSTSIPIIKLIVYNFVYTIISIIMVVFIVPKIPVSGSGQAFLMSLVRIFGAIGLIVTVFSCFLYFIIGNGKILGRSLVQWVVRVGYKLHIVKNYRESFDKLMHQVKEYQSSIKYLNKHKGTLFITVFLCLVECLAFSLIPFCVTMAFGKFAFTSSVDIVNCILLCVSQYFLSLLVGTCLPLPGGTGTMEICYIFLFAIGPYSVGENIVWALLAFRLLTYYLVLIQGFIHIIGENICRAINAHKQKKKSLITN